MRVRIREDNSLIIIAETDFEEEYLRKYSSQGQNKAWLKHGASVSDLVGLVIERAFGPQKEE
jgi:hypothetical protein